MEKKERKLGKRLLSLFMALAMVLTSIGVTPVEKVYAAGGSGTVRLYLELPSGTSAGDWAANCWGGAVVTGGPDVRIGGTWNCFLQALFGQNCKIFLDIVACPNWTMLQ